MDAVQKIVDDLGIDQGVETALLNKGSPARKSAAEALLTWIPFANLESRSTTARAKTRDGARYELAASALELVKFSESEDDDMHFGDVRREAYTQLCKYAPAAEMCGHALQAWNTLHVNERSGFEKNFTSLLKEFREQLERKKLVVKDGLKDPVLKLMAMPAFYIHTFTLGQLKNALVLRPVLEGEAEPDANELTLEELLAPKFEGCDNGLPNARAKAVVIKSMCVRSGWTTVDSALLELGVRLGDVVTRVGSWNICATGRFHECDDTTVTADAVNDDAEAAADAAADDAKPKILTSKLAALESSKLAALEFKAARALKSKLAALKFKAARVRACANDQNWHAFALQEAPLLNGKVNLMDKFVESLTEKFRDAPQEWAFVPVSTAVEGNLAAGEGCVFGYCADRWEPVCEPLRYPNLPVTFARTPVVLLLRVKGSGTDACHTDNVLALVSVHLTPNKSGPKTDGLDGTRKEVKALGGGAFTEWLCELRSEAEHFKKAPVFSCLLLGDFNLGPPESHDPFTVPQDAWEELVRFGFKFANVAPGYTNMAEFAVKVEDKAGHAFDNALLLASLPRVTQPKWLAKHPRCTTVALPDDLMQLKKWRDECEEAAMRTLPDIMRELALAAVKDFRTGVCKQYSDHKPLTVHLILDLSAAEPAAPATGDAAAAK
jgi:hypothetical protein